MSILKHLGWGLLTYGLVTILVGLRPLLGPATCRYEIGCTQFTVMQLQTLPFHQAVVRSIQRVLSCNPFFKYRDIYE